MTGCKAFAAAVWHPCLCSLLVGISCNLRLSTWAITVMISSGMHQSPPIFRRAEPGKVSGTPHLLRIWCYAAYLSYYDIHRGAGRKALSAHRQY